MTPSTSCFANENKETNTKCANQRAPRLEIFFGSDVDIWYDVDILAVTNFFEGVDSSFERRNKNAKNSRNPALVLSLRSRNGEHGSRRDDSRARARLRWRPRQKEAERKDCGRRCHLFCRLCRRSCRRRCRRNASRPKPETAASARAAFSKRRVARQQVGHGHGRCEFSRGTRGR